MSSTKVEYCAHLKGCKESGWIEQLLIEMGIVEIKHITVPRDNQSSLHMTHNPMFHGKTKHIEARYHFVRDLILVETIQLFCVPLAQQENILTNPMNKMKFKNMRLLFRMIQI